MFQKNVGLAMMAEEESGLLFMEAMDVDCSEKRSATRRDRKRSRSLSNESSKNLKQKDAKRDDNPSSKKRTPQAAFVASKPTTENDQSSDDPFPSSLKCKRTHPQQQKVLWWFSPAHYTPLAVEESMIHVLVRWKKKERGMIRDQPHFRLQQIRKLCRSTGVHLPAALSLRRHHMKRYNPHLSLSQLRLGNQQDIRESAAYFEQAVEETLRQKKIAFWTEGEHKSHIQKNRKDGESFPPTPDFILKNEIRVKKFTKHRGKKTVTEENSICWVEAKMFYGASTIEHDNKSAVRT